MRMSHSWVTFKRRLRKLFSECSQNCCKIGIICFTVLYIKMVTLHNLVFCKVFIFYSQQKSLIGDLFFFMMHTNLTSMLCRHENNLSTGLFLCVAVYIHFFKHISSQEVLRYCSCFWCCHLSAGRISENSSNSEKHELEEQLGVPVSLFQQDSMRRKWRSINTSPIWNV